MPSFYGYNAPFLGGNQKVMSQQVDERLIRNDLLQLLLTAPGERVMRPTFGTPIRNFVFQPLTATDISQLKDAIDEAVQTWEPRVNLTSILLEMTPDDNALDIRLYGTFATDRFRQLTVAPADLLIELNIPTAKANPQT
jgi:phage baseplate assembly protein W